MFEKVIAELILHKRLLLQSKGGLVSNILEHTVALRYTRAINKRERQNWDDLTYSVSRSIIR